MNLEEENEEYMRVNKGIKDTFRANRLLEKMEEYGVDYLILRLPENVLYSTGYWPIYGASMAVVSRTDEPSIFYNDGEDDFVAESWVDDIRSYPYFTMDEQTNPNKHFARMLTSLWKEKGYNPKGVIGYEGGFEFIGTQELSVEARVPAEKGMRMLRETFPEATFVDAYKLLVESRLVKSEIEIEKMRRACEVTCFGYDAARKVIQPGIKDCEVSAAVEQAIRAKGIGYKGARRARGYAFACSGINTNMIRAPFFVTSDRVMKEGEVSLIELDSYTDGYFCDMTRTIAAGKPREYDIYLWNIVMEELNLMLSMIKPGVKTADICQAAREVAWKYGFTRPKCFPHQPGHGIGLQFHEIPGIHVCSKEVLVENSCLSLEPHVYDENWGGMRLEQNLVVRKNGYELLTNHPLELSL